jgi:hypothetical protein
MTRQEQLKTLAKRIRDDGRWYIERFLQIRDKNSRIVPLKLSNNQAFYYEQFWKPSELAGIPIRDIVLKARQTWMSTGVGGIFFHKTATNKNIVTQVVSHEEDSVDHIFGMHRLFYDLLPQPLKPMQRYSNRKELVFENPDNQTRPEKPGLRSKIMVALARNIRAGHSKTINYLHLSEGALYPAFIQLLTGFLPAVPFKPNTAIVIETTASNVGTELHKFWLQAKLGPGDPNWNGFRAVFIPWFSHSEYALPFGSPEERASFLNSLVDQPAYGSPLTAQKLYDLTDEQLHWRQKTMANFDSPELFFQQYPENDVDCWFSTGSCAFPVPALREMRKATTSPKWRGYLETYTDDRDPRNPQEKIRFVDDPKGPLSIWKMPTAEGQYAIGADTSEGLAGGDYASGDVFDKETCEQVAQWHGLVDPDLFGSDVLTNLGWYYRNAEIGVERNNHGLTTLVALKRAGYSNLFRSMQVDERTNKTTQKLGWLTTRQSKPLMVDEIRQRVRERSVTINSADTIDECLTYVRQPDGTTAAQQNCKDDRVMSLGVVLQVIKHNPYITRRPRKHLPEPAVDAVTGY